MSKLPKDTTPHERWYRLHVKADVYLRIVRAWPEVQAWLASHNQPDMSIRMDGAPEFQFKTAKDKAAFAATFIACSETR